MTRDEFISNPLTVVTQRDPADYKKSLQFLETHPQVTIYQGIKSDSVFNKLSNFHVCKPGLPPCLAHNLFDGVVDYDLAMCLQYLIKSKIEAHYKSRQHIACMVANRVANNPSSGPLNLIARRMNEDNFKQIERLINTAYHTIKK